MISTFIIPLTNRVAVVGQWEHKKGGREVAFFSADKSFRIFVRLAGSSRKFETVLTELTVRADGYSANLLIVYEVSNADCDSKLWLQSYRLGLSFCTKGSGSG